MSTNFPTSLDSYTTKVDSTDYPQAAHINNPQDAIVALETKVGVNSSAVTTSHDYKIAQLESGRTLTNGSNATGTWSISTSGNAATATTLQTARTINGTSFNGSANITVTASTTQVLTMNNGGAGAASGTTFDGGTARTISYNTIGAPSTTGTNASGTWGISISGNAATATTASSITGQGNLATTNANAAETRNISGKSGTTKTLSTSAPSGGSDGDIWYKY